MIYLDNNATTQPDARVIEAMLPYLTTHWGNPSSIHAFGRNLHSAIDQARQQVADFVGAKRASEIIFTSGGTESDNLALRAISAAQPEKKHIVTSQIEHSAVLQCCQQLEREGYEVTYLPVTANGQVSCESVQNALRSDTACVSIMWANNETGVLNPIAEIAELCNDREVPLHTDAVAAAGKVELNCDALGVDALSIAGHKIHAPKGCGALYLRRGTPFKPMIVGGGHEYGRRAGTVNVPLVIALGTACALAQAALDTEYAHVKDLRDRLQAGLLELCNKAQCNGGDAPRICNTCNISFPGVDGEGLIMALCDAGLAASTGSACRAGSSAPSHVLTAMNLANDMLQGSLRLSLSRDTTAEEVEQAIRIIAQVVRG